MDPEAYKAYLIGLHNFRKYTLEGARAALRHFQAAIARDPNNALAHAGVAQAYALYGSRLLPRDEWQAAAEAQTHA